MALFGKRKDDDKTPKEQPNDGKGGKPTTPTGRDDGTDEYVSGNYCSTCEEYRDGLGRCRCTSG